MAFKVPAITFGECNLRPDAPPLITSRALDVLPGTSTEGDQLSNGTAAARKREQPPKSDEEAAKRLKLTVLAPFFDRIRKDGEENLRLRQMNAELAALNERQHRQLANTHDDDQKRSEQQLLLEAPNSHGIKRKAPPPSPMKIGRRESGDNEHTSDGHLMHLANQISKDLEETVTNETIHLCGLGPLKIMDARPDEVLELAHQKLSTWPYKSVPMCWRRLYEDAALSKAASMLREEAERIGQVVSFKRRRLNGETLNVPSVVGHAADVHCSRGLQG